MRAEAVEKSYGGKTVLKLGEVELPEGEVTLLLGANGSGKSTYARILAGVLSADAGKVPFRSPVRTGYLPQRAYPFRMSTEKNLRIASRDQEREDRLIRQLGLEPLRKTNARNLSGGEASRMSLARLLMADFELLILDEPTAAMDMEFTAATERVVREYIEKTRCACLMITHNIRQAARMDGQVLFLKDGRLAESGAGRTCLEHPATGELKAFLDFYG